MRKVHPEFAYQSRELEGQIDGILGDPPNRKNYDMMQQALMSEYADGGGIEDVNMMSFALVDHIRFIDPKGLLAQSVQYDEGDPFAPLRDALGEYLRQRRQLTEAEAEVADLRIEVGRALKEYLRVSQYLMAPARKER